MEASTITAIGTALGTAFSDITTNFGTWIVAALPYALGIMGVMVALTLVVRYFKRVAK